jgi:hypothetical protein
MSVPGWLTRDICCRDQGCHCQQARGPLRIQRCLQDDAAAWLDGASASPAAHATSHDNKARLGRAVHRPAKDNQDRGSSTSHGQWQCITGLGVYRNLDATSRANLTAPNNTCHRVSLCCHTGNVQTSRRPDRILHEPSHCRCPFRRL